MEKRMLKNWAKLTNAEYSTMSIPEHVFVPRELTRGQLKSWMLHPRDRADALDWMPVDIVQAGAKVIIYYANIATYNGIDLTLTIYNGKCELTEYVQTPDGTEFTVHNIKHHTV